MIIQSAVSAKYIDQLTGLLNEVGFNKQLVERVAKREPSCVFIVNVDDFTAVNTSISFKGGDMILVDLANRFTDTLRSYDMVARLQHNEFAILVTKSISHKDAELLAKRLLSMFKKSFRLNNEQVDIAASIGYYSVDDNVSASDAIINAREAMKTAKFNRLGYICYEDILKQYNSAKDPINLIHDIKRAITRNELFLVYQPVRNLATGKIPYVEAFIRWKHPSLGILEPGAFIPIIEHSKSIELVTEWVIKTAIADCQRWNLSGVSTGVSINISARDLSTTNFLVMLSKQMAAIRFDSTKLILELVMFKLYPYLSLTNFTLTHSIVLFKIYLDN